MCGLFGWSVSAGVERSKLKRMYRLLSHGNDQRGGHSYGAYLIDQGRVAKGLGRMERAQWGKGGSPIECRKVLCHTRWATHGAVHVTNAHPFRVGGVVGAHNGVIYNHEEMNKKHGRDFEVDSKHIFAHLDEGKGLGDLTGYGAITYVEVEKEPGVVWLGRFCFGELAVARLKGGEGEDWERVEGIVWSSDEDHLKAGLQAAGLVYELVVIENGKLYAVRGEEIYETGKTIEVQRGWANTSASRWRGWRGWQDEEEAVDVEGWAEWKKRMDEVDEELELEKRLERQLEIEEEKELLREMRESGEVGEEVDGFEEWTEEEWDRWMRGVA